MALKTITFTCETITPMFLSGADGSTPELRPPSIKGALRFWWRAMNGHLSLEELKELEDYIFGGSGNRSKILIRVKMLDKLISKKDIKSSGKNELIYMAYGAEKRKYFDVGTQFQILFGITEQDENKSLKIENQLKKAFSLLTHLGGLGAKSRNGFGSFVSKDVDSFEAICKYEVFKNKELPLYTAITKNVEIYQSTNEFFSWQKSIMDLKNLYADNAKRGITSKTDRKYIAAPYKTIPIPVRHAKLHLMSITKTAKNEMIYVITYMPYDYMNGYEGLEAEEIKSHNSKWKKVVKSFNENLENAERKRNEFFLDFTFKNKKQ